MKRTVTGLFKTYDDARHAQNALLQRGFAVGDIELPLRDEGVLVEIERFVAGLLSTEGASSEMPRDNVRIGVRVLDDAQADAARDTLRDQQALEIATRRAGWTWPTRDDADARERSALDELGLADLADAVRRHAPAPSAVPSAGEVRSSEATPSTDARVHAEALAAAGAPGSGAVMGASPEVPKEAAVSVRPTGAATTAPPVPDEFLEYEEDSHEHRGPSH